MSHDEQGARACRISVWGRGHGPVIWTQNNPNHQHLARINRAKNGSRQVMRELRETREQENLSPFRGYLADETAPTANSVADVPT